MKNVPVALQDCLTLCVTAPRPCVFVDRKGRVVTANAPAGSLLGCEPAALTGLAAESFFRSTPSLFELMKYSGSDCREAGGSLAMNGAAPVPASCLLQRVRTGPRRIHHLLWFEDNREILKLRERLEHSEKLSAMAIVAGKVAHEIRTPLNAIFLNNDLLQEHVEKMRGPQGVRLRRYIGILQEEVDRLNEVVRSYLSLARLAGSDRQSTAMEPFLEGFIAEVREEYARREISVDTAFRAGPRDLSVNQRQFRRLMLNLFSNSRDAMKNGGVITVSTECTSEGFRITVSDTGEGIPPESLTKLTTPFTSLKSNGSGLGLYLVREIVEHHGGRIDIRSLQGEGTSVIVTLPLPGRRGSPRR